CVLGRCASRAPSACCWPRARERRTSPAPLAGTRATRRARRRRPGARGPGSAAARPAAACRARGGTTPRARVGPDPPLGRRPSPCVPSRDLGGRRTPGIPPPGRPRRARRRQGPRAATAPSPGSRAPCAPPSADRGASPRARTPAGGRPPPRGLLPLPAGGLLHLGFEPLQDRARVAGQELAERIDVGSIRLLGDPRLLRDARPGAATDVVVQARPASPGALVEEGVRARSDGEDARAGIEGLADRVGVPEPPEEPDVLAFGAPQDLG